MKRLLSLVAIAFSIFVMSCNDSDGDGEKKKQNKLVVGDTTIILDNAAIMYDMTPGGGVGHEIRYAHFMGIFTEGISIADDGYASGNGSAIDFAIYANAPELVEGEYEFTGEEENLNVFTLWDADIDFDLSYIRYGGDVYSTRSKSLEIVSGTLNVKRNGDVFVFEMEGQAREVELENGEPAWPKNFVGDLIPFTLYYSGPLHITEEELEDPIDPNYEVNFIDQPLSGKVNGEDWTFVSGNAEAYGDGEELWLYLYKIENECGSWGDTDVYMTILNEVSVQSLLGRPVVMYNDSDNDAARNGAVEILSITDTEITARMDAYRDEDNYLNGNFTISICE